MRRLTRLLGLAVMVVLGVTEGGASQAPRLSGRQIVEDAARALGGLDRVLAVKNITLMGYGTYAYMFGSGNITASPNAPQRFQAANDLRRVYDLEHGRFQLYERRAFLFNFAGDAARSYVPTDQRLDGDIAYDIAPDGTVRRALRWSQTPWQVDGVHVRRMLMLSNPVAVVRAALHPATKLANPRTQGAFKTVDLILEEGDTMTLATAVSTNRPAWVRWSNPHENLGQLAFTTYFEGYVPFKNILLPLGYKTTIDWRNLDYVHVSVDGYEIDGDIPDLAVPEAVRSAPEPTPPLPVVTATPLARGIWRLSTGWTVFEFADHLTLFDINNKRLSQPAIDVANTLVPGKVLTQVITSHAHFDHVAGLRVAVANGLAVISRRGNESVIRDMATRLAPDYPDELSRNPKPLKFIPVDEHLRLSDTMMTLDVYWSGGNTHMADGLFAYAPSQKVMAEADMATAARDFQFWPDNYMDVIERYALDVETLSGVHMAPMKHTDVIALIKEGVARARQRCAEELAKGSYFAGCPVQTKRY